MKKSYGSIADSSAAAADDGESSNESNNDASSSSSETSSEDLVSSIHYVPTPVARNGRRERSLSVQRKAELFDEQAAAADRIGELLAQAAESEQAGDPDAEETARAADDLLRKSLRLPPIAGKAAAVAGGGVDTPPLELDAGEGGPLRRSMRAPGQAIRRLSSSGVLYGSWEKDDLKPRSVLCKVVTMFSIAIGGLLGVMALFALGKMVVGPPNQPVGNYRLVELQEGDQFFDYYNFYAGPDSVGSNGYITYVSKERAMEVGIARVATEPVPEDERPDGTPIGGDDDGDDSGGVDDVAEEGGGEDEPTSPAAMEDARKLGTKEKKQEQEQQRNQNWSDDGNETFVYLSSAPTEEGPRESVRLEGKRRFNRGLFILDLRHMPAGCGAWPAFWLTDEANWPVNGEIDIVEGVSYQSEAKTALHSTKGCNMDDVPNGVKSGTWDTAVGIPDKKTGIPDMTFRYATDCYVYNPHQWINQGCVAVDLEGDTLGQPLNDKGGGVYALEWDPINRKIRTWVFTPHRKVPPNLMDSIRTADKKAEERIAPDPEEWGLPYGYFPIGSETSCPLGHFRNMRLVINLAFCGSVAGNRYFLDCPRQFKKYKTCNQWVKSNPKELEEAYWKIRGVYVYEREWEKKWV